MGLLFPPPAFGHETQLISYLTFTPSSPSSTKDEYNAFSVPFATGLALLILLGGEPLNWRRDGSIDPMKNCLGRIRPALCISFSKKGLLPYHGNNGDTLCPNVVWVSCPDSDGEVCWHLALLKLERLWCSDVVCEEEVMCVEINQPFLPPTPDRKFVESDANQIIKLQVIFEALKSCEIFYHFHSELSTFSDLRVHVQEPVHSISSGLRCVSNGTRQPLIINQRSQWS